MRVEAVRDDAIPSKQGLFRDERVIQLNARSAASPTSFIMTTTQRSHSPFAAYWQQKLLLHAIRTMPAM
jgi:hypothetical protein